LKTENAIEVKNLCKYFKIYLDRGYNLRDYFFSKRRKYTKNQVLDDISFEVKKGEAIGLIGHNGCGKSTTLKMLTRIMYPESGTIEMCGRVSSLIELGAGFHPELTGRENIFINASIFGLTRKEIEERLEDIIAFSELGEAIDNPVRTYSSGMYMRLAFSVAINVDADILLIDEILAVGDAGFQSKCFNKLERMKAEGVTIVIVSHSLDQIEKICDRSYWLNDGKIVMSGAPRDVHPYYLEFMAKERQAIAQAAANGGNVEHVSVEDIGTFENPVNLYEFWMEHGDLDNKSVQFTTGEKVSLYFRYETKVDIENAVVGIDFFRVDGCHCYGTNTQADRYEQCKLSGKGIINIEIDPLNLLSGHYLLDFSIKNGDGLIIGIWKGILEFDIFSVTNDLGVCRLEHKWNIL